MGVIVNIYIHLQIGVHEELSTEFFQLNYRSCLSKQKYKMSYEKNITEAAS
jgi:hypothetical protein